MEQNKQVATTEINRMKQMWGWWRAKLNIARQSPWYASYLLRRFYDLMKALRPSQQLVASTVTGAALLVGSMALNPAPAHAATITVNSTSDSAPETNSGDGNCTLREALTNANNPANTDLSGGDCVIGTGGGSDTIDLTGVNGTILLTADFPYITNDNEDIVLNGPGASNLTVDGSNNFVTIRSTGIDNAVTVDSLTLQRSSRGGVFARHDVTVTDSVISGSILNGVYSRNNAIVTNSTISGNVSGGVSGFYNATVVNSTISGNRVGGVRTYYLTASVINSTISGNGYYGVYAVRENITVVNSTIIGNTYQGVHAKDGNANGAIVTLKNSLIVGNNGGAGDISCQLNSASVSSNGKNLISNSTGCTALAGEVTAVPVASIISPLANNGGSTQTHALVAGSPAIDKGNNADSPGATDQRGTGFARIFNTTIDIGAFEIQSLPPILIPKAVGGVAEFITPQAASPVTTTGVMATMSALLMGAGAWLMRR